jgi:hypothetical protein
VNRLCDSFEKIHRQSPSPSWEVCIRYGAAPDNAIFPGHSPSRLTRVSRAFLR